jgi:hypothetical protein
VSQTANQVAAIDGANGTVGYITVLNARLAQTEPSGYPVGSQARLLLWISNAGLQDDSLTGITSPYADDVSIRGDATIPAQYLSDLSGAAGTRVTVNGFNTAVPYGQSVPMTFSFATAGDITLNVPIELPTERSEDRETVEILPPHPTPLWEEGHGEGAEAAHAEEAGEG